MDFPLYIAKRYLFSKSSSNAVNIITAVSILGVAIGTMALLVVLSAFAGLEKFSTSMLTIFDPDIKITSVEGKSFLFNDNIDSIIKSNPEIAEYTRTLEEKVFLRYRDKEFISKIKGVDTNFTNVNSVDSSIYAGRWISDNVNTDEIVVGGGVSHYLSLGLNDIYKPLEVYVVRPGKGQITNPMSGFKRRDAFPVGVFAIEKEIDEKYSLSSLSFIQGLLNYDDNQISAIEIKLKTNSNEEGVANYLKLVLGKGFEVKTQREQHALVYKMMNTERIVTYLIFTLILVISVFNVIGSVSMLIVDKKKNLYTLWSMGASESLLRNTFVKVGLLVTFIGGISGIVLGSALVLFQYYFNFLTFGGGLAYPVELNLTNVIVVSITIFTIGYLASRLSVLRLNAYLLNN